MKAIHNITLHLRFQQLTVFNTSKIQNESNSQQYKGFNIFKPNCV